MKIKKTNKVRSPHVFLTVLENTTLSLCWQLMADSIKCEQARLLLTKEKHIFHKLGLSFNDLHFNGFISTVNRSRKISANTAACPQIFVCKNRKLTNFLNR